MSEDSSLSSETPLAPVGSPLPPSPYFEQPPVVAGEAPSEVDLHAERISRVEGRNVFVLAVYDVVLRVGWIFKTESVIIPAFLDAVAGAGWLRGCLPVVNRFGQSVPPAFYAGALRRMPSKKRALATWTLAMGVVFLTLAVIWRNVGNDPPWWMAAVFLILYGLFSAFHGLNQLSYGTVQGKLVSIAHRGRLMAISAPLGSGAAIVFALWLMGSWLKLPDRGFYYIFGFTGVLFVLSALTALFIAEPSEEIKPHASDRDHPLKSAWKVLRDDANFRHFGWVVMFASVGVILFPHYQALGQTRLKLSAVNLMVWVVVQNAAVGVFGLLAGWVVHRYGERLALRLSIFVTALSPLTAVFLAFLEEEWGRYLFWVVFIPMGMTPIMLKTMLGYTLEVSGVHDHPRYLSTLSLCVAAPFFLSPLVGWLVDVVGFEIMFLGGAALIMVAGVLTFRLDEPRERHGKSSAVGSGD